MIEAIAIGVFVFVVLAVAGWRALDTLESAKARRETERRAAISARAKRRDYTGPWVNRWGREVE